MRVKYFGFSKTPPYIMYVCEADVGFYVPGHAILMSRVNYVTMSDHPLRNPDRTIHVERSSPYWPLILEFEHVEDIRRVYRAMTYLSLQSRTGFFPANIGDYQQTFFNMDRVTGMTLWRDNAITVSFDDESNSVFPHLVLSSGQFSITDLYRAFVAGKFKKKEEAKNGC